MCGIAGFVGEEAWQRTCEMTGRLHHRGPDGAAVLDCRSVFDGRKACLGHTHLKVTGDYPQPALTNGKAFVFNGEIYNYREFAKVSSDTQALAGVLAGGMDGLVKAASSINGDYSLALWDSGRLSLIRDPIGVKPLFYGQNASGFGFASERKALWRAGISDVRALAPGALFNEGIEHRVIELPPYEPVLDEEDAVRALDESLTAAVRAREHKNAAVTFSGGVDSALIGAMSPDTPLLTVGMADSHDVKAARHAARLMEAEGRHIVYEITENDVEDAIARTVYAIESASLQKVSIALPTYLLAQRARKDGFKVLLSGQGADELFAGYARYEAAFREDRLANELDHDLRHLAEVNLERDDAATMAHGVELRVPYLDMRVVAASRRMGPDLKVRPLKVRPNGKDYIRKYILRKVAEKYLPREVSSAPKKAIQYGTGVQKTLERLAKSKGCTPASYLELLYRDVFR
jgi:asparagine synthase (glutamine-hydrolysing)